VLGLSASLIVLALVVPGGAHATEYYVATTGSDSNPGTMASPFATLQKGANTAVAGDTVYIRGGTYSITTPTTSSAGITFTKSGTSDTNRISYFAYPGEAPVFDFTNMVISTTGYTHGFVITASWLHFKGLEVRYVPMNTFSNNGVDVLSGGNDIFELLNMHHNSGNGIFIGSKTDGGHLLLNCDAHDNYDATSSQGQGQNADGFGVHYQTTGASTTIRGCRSWWNSDDGYDLINQEVPVTVENSWAFGNGYAMYGTFNPADGNGNGFKMGSSQTGVRHLVQNNVAWKNKASGFYANHSTGGNTWYNNTSFMNGTQYNMLASPAGMPDTTITLTGSLVHIMRNNIGYPNKNTNMTGVDTMFNTWDLGITPAAKDFASITDPSVSMTGVGVESSGALGPRAADGSMPSVDFLKLAAGSQMIDKGTDVGLPYVGSAPDLGAYEYGAATTTSDGGVGGSGGSGTGGATTTGTGGVGTGGSSTGGSTGAGAGGAAGAGGHAGTGGGGTGGTVAGTGGTGATTGTGGTTAGTGATTGTGGAGVAGQDGEGTPSSTASAGCSCAIDADGPSGPASRRSPLIMLGAASLLLARRRRATTRR
jgi:MYXO-CTERM domain-containing protein